MRPKSRLIAMRILPTICEAYEEMLEDKGSQCTRCLYINSDSVGADDYRQSICQLARPTFPTLQAISDMKSMKRMNSSGGDDQLPRIPVIKHPALQSKMPEKNKVENNNILPDKTKQSFCCLDTDPLEQLYGLKDKMPFMKFIKNVQCRTGDNCGNLLFFNTMTKKKHFDKCPESPYLERQEGGSDLSKLVSFPRVSSAQSLYKVDTCQELRNKTNLNKNLADTVAQRSMDTNSSQNANISSFHPTKENLHYGKTTQCMQQNQHLTPNTLAEDGRKKQIAVLPSYVPEKKIMSESKISVQKKVSEQQAVIQNWVSECKTAWKEARMKACLLPAIAEI